MHIIKLKILLIILLCPIIVEVKCQLIADAGDDTIFCVTDIEGSTIGGNPTAIGGIPPYYYTWYSKVQIINHTYYASTFLNDTSIANPSFKDYHDTLKFFIEVKDSIGSTATDSVTIIFSQFVYCLLECLEFINEGDSVQLNHCVFGGIPPYKYSWSPQESLSDATIPNPWAKPDTTTIYKLTIIDSAGCEAQSTCDIYVFPTNIDYHYSKNRYLKIFPNPINSQAYIIIEDLRYKKLRLEILNINGVIIKEINITNRLTSFNIKELKPGIFLYRLISDSKEVDKGKILIN